MENLNCPVSDSLNETTERARSEELALCAWHGTPIRRHSIQTGRQTISFDSDCSLCEKDAAERDRLQEQRRFVLAQGESGIPARFLIADLEPFPPPPPGQDRVIELAKAFVQTEGRSSTGLIFLGNLGAGKTHVSCAILNAFLRQGLSGRYLTMNRALRLLRETWRQKSEKTEQQALRSLSSPHLLVLDEVGVQHGTDSECVHLTEIVNDRYERNVPTILISNLTMQELTQLVGERVVDRFREGGKVLVFDWPSLRHRKSTGS